MMKKGIIGAGGFGREVYWSMNSSDRINTVFFVDDIYWNGENDKILPLSLFESSKYELVVAIGDPTQRERIVNGLPKNTKYFTHIHPSAQIHGDDIKIGEGSIICAGCILTTNISIGKHSHLNLQTTIGHDCKIGDYFTTAPKVSISGNNTIGSRVYIGTAASTKQRIVITDDTVIGLNCGVVSDINISGVYVGTPAIKIK